MCFVYCWVLGISPIKISTGSLVTSERAGTSGISITTLNTAINSEQSSNTNNHTTSIFIGVIVVGLVLIASVVITICVLFRRVRKANYLGEINSGGSPKIIKCKDLKFLEIIGKGSFGVVYRYFSSKADRFKGNLPRDGNCDQRNKNFFVSIIRNRGDKTRGFCNEVRLSLIFKEQSHSKSSQYSSTYWLYILPWSIIYCKRVMWEWEFVQLCYVTTQFTNFFC